VVQVDLAIVGAGFGGSLMAMIARRLGLSVVLLEQGKHPRVVIGESATPLSNLLLEKLCATYDLPRLAPLAKWGSWRRSYPQIACGLKRGFTFFHENGGQLLVAASPHDEVADTHWYRADVDSFLVEEAQRLGVLYHDRARIETLSIAEDGVVIGGTASDASFRFQAGFLIDATGPRGFLFRNLQLKEAPLPGLPATEALYSHFTGVAGPQGVEDADPYPVDDAAVHHIFSDGWVWVLRFSNGVTSAGVGATSEAARKFGFRDGETAWRRVLERVPKLQTQFREAVACQPFRHMPTVSFRSRTIVGQRWAMLPSAAGFVDPLLSTGFPLTLLGIERLAQVISHSYDLKQYAEETKQDLLAANRLIGALYATMGNFDAFTAVSLIYFAAVSFSETAQRLCRPELAPGFLLREHPGFWPAADALLGEASELDETRAFTNKILRLIEPFNLGRFGDPACSNRYPVRAKDLMDAREKLGASEDQIAAMLRRTGFDAAAGRGYQSGEKLQIPGYARDDNSVAKDKPNNGSAAT
jgi:tetracycline 7-halogenase / FADH2 O2-dependent halogenase